MKKIYTHIKIDMATGEVLEETSYLYDGEIAECKGGGTTTYPEPTEEERELWAEQTEFMQFQREQAERRGEWEERMTPLFYESMGYMLDPETGEYARDPRRVELEEEQLEHQLMGYKGELPIDPAVTEQFEREERLAKEGSARGGTSLVKSLSDIKQRRLMAEYAIRHGGMGGMQAFGTAFPGGGGGGGGMASYGGGGFNPYAQERANRWQSQMQNQYMRAQQKSGQMGMAMAGAGTGAMVGGPWGAAIGFGAGYLMGR